MLCGTSSSIHRKKLTKKKKTNKEITRNYQNCKESCRAGPHLLFMEEAQQKLIFTALTRMRCRGIFMIILLIFIFLRSFKNIFLFILLISIFFGVSKICPWLFYWYSYFLGASQIYPWLFYWYSYFLELQKYIPVYFTDINIFGSFKNMFMIILLIFIFLKASKIYPWLFHWYSYFLGVSKIYAWLFFWYSYF